ncbi:unnamed protein product [Rodentolepis nana]|uniref:Uncharacterized protein n=1 Tax=Rodentolepis nana TaxID=102285 RepID=A0A3P7T5G8_RODNA|nr:unnamed protein product [Rodentolepis nana]
MVSSDIGEHTRRNIIGDPGSGHKPEAKRKRDALRNTADQCKRDALRNTADQTGRDALCNTADQTGSDALRKTADQTGRTLIRLEERKTYKPGGNHMS